MSFAPRCQYINRAILFSIMSGYIQTQQGQCGMARRRMIRFEGYISDAG